MSTIMTNTILSSTPYSSAYAMAPQASAAGATPSSAAGAAGGMSAGSYAPGAGLANRGGFASQLAGNGSNAASQDPTLLATQQMMKESQEYNLQFLNLQEAEQQENRKFSTLSNVLKARHQTMQSTISNIK